MSEEQIILQIILSELEKELEPEMATMLKYITNRFQKNAVNSALYQFYNDRLEQVKNKLMRYPEYNKALRIYVI